MKQFCKALFDFSDLQLYGPSEHRKAPDRRYVSEEHVTLTPRLALQTLGDWGRRCWPDVWSAMGVKEALRLTTQNSDELCIPPAYDLAIITDCRFVNEAKMVRSVGGTVWRVTRPGATGATPGGIQGHISESEQFSAEMTPFVNAEIINGGTLQELSAKIAILLEGAP
jgi:hypothetical protein